MEWKYLKPLIMLIVIWLGVTLYFISQHSVVSKEVQIDQTIAFDDVIIELDRLVFINFEHRRIDFETTNNSIKYKLLYKLPAPVAMPFIRIAYIYSRPYVIDNDLYNSVLLGKCIFKDQNKHSTEYFDYFRDNIKIRVVDSNGAGYIGGSGARYEGNSPEIDFSIRGRNFPIEKLEGGMTVIIKHLETEEEKEIHFDYQDFTTYRHNDSFGRIESLSFN